jgi:hypothetical protein
MAEIDRTRERERPPLQDNPYEQVIRNRQELHQRNLSGPVVIKASEREVFISRQGRLHYFLDPLSFKDTPLQHWRVFTHEVRTRSGKHRHQGGLVIYVIAGRGYSIIEGERIEWEKGDLLLLPMRLGGIEHQHFNLQPGTPAVWAAFIYIPVSEYLASDMEQTEASPEFTNS